MDDGAEITSVQTEHKLEGAGCTTAASKHRTGNEGKGKEPEAGNRRIAVRLLDADKEEPGNDAASHASCSTCRPLAPWRRTKC